MTGSIGSQFKPFSRRIRRYFRAYGRWPAVIGSPLFILSLILTATSYSQWWERDWTELSLALLPSLLGFSLGTYAILFSLITSRVKDAMRAIKDDRQISALEQVNAAFFHFIFVQAVALLWAFGFKGSAMYDLAMVASRDWAPAFQLFNVLRIAGAGVGFLLLVYSVALMIGAALAIYRLALIADPGERTQ